MHHFTYRNDELYCEELPVKIIAESVGTPFYLYSHATLSRHFHAFYDAFEGVERLICYSAKANTSLAILKLFASMGGGLDIVSGGELYRGLLAGFPPEKIVYSGVGKRVDEIDMALEKGILMFNVESLEELDLLNQRAGRIGKRAQVALRVNPDVDPKTHPYIATGLKNNKFGIDAESAIEGYKAAKRLPNIRILGIDCHIGSQITEAKPFRDALENLKGLIHELKRLGIPLEYLDMGGGLGIIYDDETPPLPNEYAKAIVDSLKRIHLKLILEPGRVIVGNAGILVAKVLYRKKGKAKEFVIVDAAMNDLIRPSLYHAYHSVWPVVKAGTKTIIADLVGPICESGDFLALDRSIADVKRDDLLAVMSAGAYGFVMSSTYCSRPRIPEVMVRKDRFHVIRERETHEDLVRGESLPPFIT
ncbi:MAG: diaminopimelate decarboxylase [Deltaproteobacteria bacterium RBG_13_49_15]|nr:MAG: diaminopimelate decarboxylase [Deltaproteobacteria bacterium RBG_13_49_15]